jgi:glycerol-3-phosphate dehydrogenase (NAD(P)+)
MKNLQTIGILGAGAWGRALARVFAHAGRAVFLYGRNLPQVQIERVTPTARLDFLSHVDAVVVAVPMQSLRELWQQVLPILPKHIPVLLAIKGLELTTDLLPHQVLAAIAPDTAASLLSGPNFAAEVERLLPTATVIAGADENLCHVWAESCQSDIFRPYVSADMVGVGLGGALKNVMAIAAGIVIGSGLGENARASIITRGLVEMNRLITSRGGNAQTLMGLAGIGDLMLSCYSEQSRNFRFGRLLGQGQTADAAQAQIASTIEGRSTAMAVWDLAARQNLDLPIMLAVAKILRQEIEVADAVKILLARPRRAE